MGFESLPRSINEPAGNSGFFCFGRGDEVEEGLQSEPLGRRSRRQSPRKLVGFTSVAVIVLVAISGAPMLAGYLILPAIVLTVAAPWLARKIGGVPCADRAE